MLSEFDDSSCVASSSAATCVSAVSCATALEDLNALKKPDTGGEEEVTEDAESREETALAVPQPRPRYGLVARATSWLLDTVFGPAQPLITRLDDFGVSLSGVSIWEIREAGWLQPLQGSQLEARVLAVMSQILEVVDIAKQHAKQQRYRSRTVGWRQMLLDATAEVQSMCQQGVQTLARSDMALSALDNRWIQKVVNSRLVPQQLKHWGTFVLSPGTLETIDENSPMPVRQMQRGSEHWPADTASVTYSDETACTEADLCHEEKGDSELSPSSKQLKRSVRHDHLSQALTQQNVAALNL
jgi:hypothetical protein